MIPHSFQLVPTNQNKICSDFSSHEANPVVEINTHRLSPCLRPVSSCDDKLSSFLFPPWLLPSLHTRRTKPASGQQSWTPATSCTHIDCISALLWHVSVTTELQVQVFQPLATQTWEYNTRKYTEYLRRKHKASSMCLRYLRLKSSRMAVPELPFCWGMSGGKGSHGHVVLNLAGDTALFQPFQNVFLWKT